jgi:hypothetical protein
VHQRPAECGRIDEAGRGGYVGHDRDPMRLTATLGQ